ncbi:MAG: Holliday junction branch migration protein RuvA [Candidatus Lloydbacteria bacterium CG22_combo_CG10-13_8_21_14_all_47_15]|uniref:Holliday junction branch migration complex subunit RuvA n=1 Tax=Candidatus Lloydbacteria bacterium CG22_combo_CG10-13_8_21_14_all_47_15 TaxID=1974635 RepID=A0A2H0CU72_9BACT|nr:MAG: Holliday junction branch migration protein RuvA [Candidatus Lloydbacteria bacterium CG22_combo_CG10-13_8_21_14_all_47_15]
MIARLSGTVSFSGERQLILDVGGVGYSIHATGETIRTAQKAKEVTLWTHLAVREDALTLFGFLTRSELEFFELLLSVPGIGPKSALGIISVAPLDTLRRAVGAGDTSYLTKVSGIGTKNAHKIVIELKSKIGTGGDNTFDAAILNEEREVLDALEALGYSPKETRETLKKIPAGTEGVQAKIKAALKMLGK